jgi:ABC-type uncharacterized transport system ATPase subunit
VCARRPQYAAVEAVRSPSFQMEAGELLGFIGPNGAGKSTTIKMLTGILLPSGGQAQVLGYTPWKQRRELAASFLHHPKLLLLISDDAGDLEALCKCVIINHGQIVYEDKVSNLKRCILTWYRPVSRWRVLKCSRLAVMASSCASIHGRPQWTGGGRTLRPRPVGGYHHL